MPTNSDFKELLKAFTECLRGGSAEQQARNAVEHERFERGLKSLRMLVQVGMKMMVKLQQGHKQLRQELRDSKREMQDQSTATKAEVRALLRAQKQTDGKLDRLIDAMLRQHTNGRPRKQ